MIVPMRSRARIAANLSTCARAATTLALGSLLIACGGDDQVDAQPQTTKPRGFAPQPAAVAEPPREAARPPAPQRAPDPYLNPFGQRKEEAQAEEAPAEEEKPRDYSEELLVAMRGAEACVKARPANETLPREVFVSLEGLVLESGTVVSGSARGPVLTPEELECMKQRLQSARLPAGVKDAPRRVSSSLKLTFRAPAAPAQPKDGTQTGGSGAAQAATPSAVQPQVNPDEDPPEPIRPQDQDPPEQVIPSVIPSQN